MRKRTLSLFSRIEPTNIGFDNYSYDAYDASRRDQFEIRDVTNTTNTVKFCPACLLFSYISFHLSSYIEIQNDFNPRTQGFSVRQLDGRRKGLF